MAVQRLEIEVRPGLSDPRADATRRRLTDWLGLEAPSLRTRKVFHLDSALAPNEAADVLDALCDPIAERGAVGNLPDVEGADRFAVTVGFRAGVTDAVGLSVKRAAEDRLGRELQGSVYTSTLYAFGGVARDDIERAAAEVLHNPLIERIRTDLLPRTEVDLEVPRAGGAATIAVETVALLSADDDALERISHEGLLALNLAEMKAIRSHFAARGRDPTDAELECLAQTWSEHCKHKIFAAPIDYVDREGAKHHIERGLFRSYIRGATEAVAADRLARGLDPVDEPFLVSVFHDNAGVVRFSEADHLVYKVETHNSPSALDPYGGAMTGIVGVNRDAYGTGLGADLLTNVWGYCLGDPEYSGELPPGLMPPRRIREGVHEGVIDGGNQCGIPYSRGFELFDDRYVGKPLVYCGTVSVMPVRCAGHPTHEKRTEVGDAIVMIGGRIGKDGIHGATFSSVELDEDSPVQAVQIGDPITQRMMFDMLAEARDLGLYSGLTDNGAGGLSSSVGEMAEATGGARIDLAKAPLKYPGLAPWEILISEAQERMTLAVRPHHLEAFLELAARREVEATVLGEFTDDGRLRVDHGQTVVADLELEFLHHGVPLPALSARWSPPPRKAPVSLTRAASPILALLSDRAVTSGEPLARHYDHEVKGLAVVKPLIGRRGDVPSTATVMRVRHHRDEGLVLAEGIHPHYGDLDTDAMARACVDEGVRRLLCAGARLDRIAALDNFCWPDPIVSEKTPDGEHKLAQLVRCCQGLDAACKAYGVPLISGKDSMKNDATLGGIKISIPPTLLVSVIGQMADVREALTLEPRTVGESVYVLGPTRDELGGTVFERVSGQTSAVPRTTLEASWARYRAFAAARDAGLIRSAHATGRGGLGIALVHMVLASELGLSLDCSEIAPTFDLAMGSESTGRIVFCCAAQDEGRVEAALEAHALLRLGTVEADPRLDLRHGELVFTHDLATLRRAFTGGQP